MKRRSLRRSHTRAAYLVLSLMALANSGCLLLTAGAVGGAAAGYAYCNGKLCATYNASLDDTWAATRTALGELGMPVVTEQRRGADGFIESRTADGERVRIYLEARASKIPAEGEIAWVCVRVATFGDQPVSERILDQVGMHLAPAAPLASPAAPGATLGVIQTVLPASTAPSASAPASAPPQTGPPPLLPPNPEQVQKQAQPPRYP